MANGRGVDSGEIDRIDIHDYLTRLIGTMETYLEKETNGTSNHQGNGNGKIESGRAAVSSAYARLREVNPMSGLDVMYALMGTRKPGEREMRNLLGVLKILKSGENNSGREKH